MGLRTTRSVAVGPFSEQGSKGVLALEAVLLAYPSLLALPLVSGSIAPVAVGNFAYSDLLGAMAGCLVLGGLVSGWRLTLGLLFMGRRSVKSASRAWWYVATAVAAASLAVWALYGVSNYAATHGSVSLMPVGSAIGILGYGAYFIPSYVHLCSEVWLRSTV